MHKAILEISKVVRDVNEVGTGSSEEEGEEEMEDIAEEGQRGSVIF